MIRVLFHFDAGPALRAELAALKSTGLDVVCCPEDQDEPFLTELAKADVIWHVLKPITRDVLGQAPNLRLIQKIGVGVNTIDLDAAAERGITVCNMPGTNSRAVAEMTLLLMLAALRRLPVLDRVCRDGQWAPDKATSESLGEIGGRTIGFVGFGAVPNILAPILTAMGADIIYTARSRKDVPYRYCPLDQVVSDADILSLHIPLTGDTEHLIDAGRMAAMKRGAILINTARGPLVDEAALVEALKSGQIGAAGLDVFTHEPAPANTPLFALANVVVAPHVAWLTGETFSRSISVAADNSLAVMEGRIPNHLIV